MKVSFDRDVLLSALIPAAGIVPGRNMSTGTDGVLFECSSEDQSSCTLCVYDLEKGMRTTIDATVYEGGSFILNTQKILQIARTLPDGELMIDVSPELITTVSSGAIEYKIGALKGENFPHLPLLSGDRNYTMPQHEFRDIVGRTVYAAAQHDPKPQCNGVYFVIENGKMTLVALDGFRLAINETNAPEDSADAKVLVPSKILLELMKLIADSEDEITISLARKHIIFKIDNSVYFARIIDAEYVKYMQMLPKVHKTEVFVGKSEFLASLERALLITEDKLGGNYRTYIKMTFEDNVIKLAAESTSGSFNEQVPASKNGEDLVIGFHCRYMIEALRNLPDDVFTVRIRMSTVESGAVIEDAKGSGFIDPTEEEAADENGLFRTLFYVMPRRMNK